MGKKHLKKDRVETYYAAIPYNGVSDRIAWSSVRPTPLEVAEYMARVNPHAGVGDPAWQVVEISIGWNVDANGELPV